MSLSLASPDWPPEPRSGGHLRRFGLPYFVLLSLLVHGLALLMRFDLRPLFAVEEGKTNLSVELRRGRNKPSLLPELALPNQPPKPPAVSTARGINSQPNAASPTLGAFQMRQPPVAIDTTDLVERSKAELNAASRRQMLDPMFAPASHHASRATPLERAAAIADTKIEERGASVMRVTNADGSHYCLQRLPEIATRDIPVPVLSVPLKCQ
jgi:hypothetical protein